MKTNMMSIYNVTALILISCLPASALLAAGQTWYVDYVNGSDSNSGTEQSPWQTLTPTAQTAASDDTIIILSICPEIFETEWPENLNYRAAGVTQFGITWTFDQQYQIGRFANGDFWVVGPVNIIAINPPSEEIDNRTKNGAMINPSPLNSGHGYDSAMGNYDAALNVALNISTTAPLTVSPNSSLVSSISIHEAGHRPQLQTAAILTVLAEPAAAGSFRPPYCGTDKTIHFNKTLLDYSLLASLKPVPRVPELIVVERWFERPWLDHIVGWTGRDYHPAENMPDYGRDMADQIGIASLVLHLNFSTSEKEKLLIRFAQLGLDMHGIMQKGGYWANNGGHASGRKWPILFAGLVLHDPAMKAIGQKSGDYLYAEGHGPGNIPDDYIHFGEDDQTFYVRKHPAADPPAGNCDYDIYTPPYEIHGYHDSYQMGTATLTKGSTQVVGSDTKWTQCSMTEMFGVKEDAEIWDPQGRAYEIAGESVIDDTHLELTEPYRGLPEDPEGTVYENMEYLISDFVYYGHGVTSKYLDAQEYIDEDADLPEWGILHATSPSQDNKLWETPYRQCCTANAWAGYLLAARIMNAQNLWNHDALFDYMDRYMQTERELGHTGGYMRQWSRFNEDMWDFYRPLLGNVWPDRTPPTINIPNDIDSLQTAIDLAPDGSIIIVAPGTYTENIDFHGKVITIQSTDPNDPDIVSSTIIDGNETGPVITFDSGETNAACLRGFTITNGRANYGSAIYINAASPTIEHNIITGNHAIYWGAALCCLNDASLIRYNTICDNHVPQGSAAVRLENSQAALTNNLIVENTAAYGSALSWWLGSPQLINNTIANNYSSFSMFTCLIALDAESPAPIIRNNIIADNQNGAGIYFYTTSPFSLDEFHHNNLYANTPANYGGALTPYSPVPNNISADPLFAALENSDYHLQSALGRWDPTAQQWQYDSQTSQCIDAGDPDDSYNAEPPPRGNAINLGAYGNTAQASISLLAAQTNPDLNHDGSIDILDTLMLAESWLFQQPLLAADLNCDGVVNLIDYQHLSLGFDTN